MSETPVPPSYTPPPPPGGGSYTPPPAPPPPPGGGAAPGSDRNVMLFLSYFGIFALIPLLTKKYDAELQWHSKNGLALAVAWIVVWIVFAIVGVVLPFGVKFIWSGIGCLVALGFLVLDI